MKVLVCVVSALIFTDMTGCAILDWNMSPANSGADLAGTYSGPDGTIVIQKVEDAHLLQSQEEYRASQAFATLPSKMKKAKKKKFSDTGRIAPNAYLVTATLKHCPIKINNVALLENGSFSGADVDGPYYTLIKQADGSLDLFFPMSDLPRSASGEADCNCMAFSPFAKVTR